MSWWRFPIIGNFHGDGGSFLIFLVVVFVLMRVRIVNVKRREVMRRIEEVESVSVSMRVFQWFVEHLLNLSLI